MVGVYDSPGLEVRDGLLDDVANLVDLCIEFLLPIQGFVVGGLLDRGDHILADVSLSTHPVAGVAGRVAPSGSSELIAFCTSAQHHAAFRRS